MEVINTETGLLGSREDHEVCSKLSRQEKANTPFDLQSFELEIFKSLSIFSSVQFSCSVVSDSLQPHELQNARPPCPSPSLRVHSDSRPLSQ